MSVSAFLAELQRLGVDLRREGDDLVVDAPTGVLTAELRERLGQEKGAILAYLADVGDVVGSDTSTVDRGITPREASYRDRLLQSSAQQRLWYLNQLDPEEITYNIWTAFELQGPLDVSALHRSVQDVVARHDALRTTFALEDGRPVQVITPVLDIDLPVTTAPTGAVGSDWVERALEECAWAPFDLAGGPLVRVLLVRLADDHHVFLFATHHIVVDGWSLALIRSELIQLYEAFVDGRPSPLVAPALQYPDFTLWHHRLLESADVERQLAYWKDHLAGTLPLLDLPTDHPRPNQRSERGSQESLRLPADLVDALADVGQTRGSTLFMVLLTVLKVLLARYTGQDDIIVGSPIANRMLPETEDIVGYFANTLVMRTTLDLDLPFDTLLSQVRETCLEAYGNQDVPFERLVEELNPERSLDRTPLFQVMLAFQDQGDPAPTAGGLTWRSRRVRNRVARTDLTLSLDAVGGGIDATFEYSTDLFEGPTVARMAAHFERLLRGVAADPGTRAADLPLLGEEERDTLLRQWNDTGASYPRDQRIDELIATRTRETPDAVAIECGDVAWSYAEFAERHRAVADQLRALGVGPGTLVGICMERSAEMLVAVLATFEAGGAYVPLDPTYPQERLDFMLEDAGAAVLLTQAGLVDRYATYGGHVVCLDRDGRVQSAPDPVPSPGEGQASPDELAYVIYTSGSTGRPKGVQVPHRPVVNYLTSMAVEPGFTPADRLLAVSTLSFDISVGELLLPLTVGGTTVIADDEAVLDGGRLATLIDELGITVMGATPATWRMMVDAGWKGAPGLKIITSGERLPAGLAEELVPRCGELWNLYGPTETTIHSSGCLITAESDLVTIGRPVANTQLYILDRHQQPVPVGVPGELYIGGDGVTRGYLDRPELTAERFVPDPFVPDGGRLYRTGDRARYLADGRIDVLGRTDYQVKVRGYRIELGEIEAALDAMEEIAEAVVVVHGAETGDARLVAYVVYQEGTFLTVSDVRRTLRESLPDYMIPGLVMELTALPRTPNGKIDRRQLPDPFGDEEETPVDKAPPASETEQLIAEVWQELLPSATVGRQDNFFELGGHSLLSLKAIAAIERQTGQRLDPRLLFFQTLEQLGAVLSTHVDAAS